MLYIHLLQEYIERARMEGGMESQILSNIIEGHSNDYDPPFLNYSSGEEMSEDESDYEGDTEDF